MMVEYWRQIERLIARAAEAGMDLAVSAPRMEKGGLGRYNMVYEHQLLEPGAAPLSRLGQTWHVYRCAGGLRHG
jgi:hypothetical protein